MWGVWADTLCLVFANAVLCIMARQLHFELVCLKDIAPEVIMLAQPQVCNPKPCCYVFREKKRLSPSSPSNQNIIFSVFTLPWSRKYLLSLISISCFCVFWNFLSTAQCDLWVTLLGCPILRRLWDSVNTHLNAPDQQPATTSAFMEVLPIGDDLLIINTWLPLTFLIPGC